MAESKMIDNKRLQEFARDYFVDDPLLVESFMELVVVGQKHSVGRELSTTEMKNLADKYVEHIKKEKITEKDLMKQVVSYKLAQRDLAVKHRQSQKEQKLYEAHAQARNSTYSRDRREKIDETYGIRETRLQNANRREGNTLTGFRKIRFIQSIAQEMKYPVKYKLGMPLELMKGMDARHHGKGDKRILKLDEVFAREFARMEMKPKEAVEYTELNHGELRSIYQGTKQRIIDGYKSEQSYTGVPGTKQKMRKLAATVLIAASLAGAAYGVTDRIQTTINNNQQYAYSTTMEAAHKAGNPTGAFLSTSRPDVKLESWEQLPTDGSEDRYATVRYVKELIRDKGVAGLYDDVEARLNEYEQTIPSKEEREILLKELEMLPEYIIDEKFAPLYEEIKDKDENFYHPNHVVISHHIDEGGEDYFASFYDTRFTTAGMRNNVVASATSRDLKPIYEAQNGMESSLSTLRALEHRLGEEGVDEYQIYSQMQEQFKNLSEPMEEFGRLATQDLSARKGWFIFSNKIGIKDNTFTPNDEVRIDDPNNGRIIADSGEER